MSPHGLAQRNVQGPPQSNLGADRPGTLSGSLQLSIPKTHHETLTCGQYNILTVRDAGPLL